MKNKPSEKKYAIAMMLMSALAFSLMAIFVRLSGDLPVVQKSIFRSGTIMIISGIIFYKNKQKLRNIGNYKLLSIRLIAGTLGIILNYYAIDHLILSDADVLFRLSTVIVLILSWIFLKESLSKMQFIATMMAFLGVIFIVKPQFSIDLIPYIIALLGSLSAAIAYTALRALGSKVNPTSIVFIFSTFTTIVLAPHVALNFKVMTLPQCIYVIIAGICAAIGQYGVTLAYKYAPANVVSIYNYYGVIFTTFLGAIFFKQYPDPLSYIGYAIIFSSSYLLYKYNRKI